nr:NADH:flavin oxidoreductase [Maliibacterium massiliense]
MSILKTPLHIRGMQLQNRLVMPPMATYKSNADGSVSHALCDYYAEKARGGHVGLIITEHSFISPLGRAGAGQLSLAADCDMPGLRRLTDVIHSGGARVIAQINHAGSAASAAVIGAQPVAPSACRNAGTRFKVHEMPRALTPAQIDAVVADFAAAAARVREAGFDGVEIHSAHGYLLNQFYSPLTNQRTDDYGGSLDNRIRLHLRVIAAVRAQVGADFVVALRLGATDDMPGGVTLAESVLAAARFAQAGVDLLDISGGMCGYVRTAHMGQGYFRDITAAVRQAVGVPVLLTGGVTDVEAAEALLAYGDADLIGVGRAIMQDSLWAARAMEALD